MKTSYYNYFLYSFIVVSIIVGNISPARADVASTIEEKLLYAESIRSSKPLAFDMLLDEMKLELASMSSEQKYHFQYLQAYRLSYIGKLDEAISIYKSIANSNAGELLKFRANITLLNTLADGENWLDGMSYLQTSLEHLSQITDKKTQQIALGSIAIFYNRLGQYELGLNYSKQLAQIASPGRNQCVAKKLIVEAKLNLRKITAFGSEIQQTLDICEQSNEFLATSELQINVAQLLLESGLTDKALVVLDNNISTAEKTTSSRVISDFYSLLAETHWQLNHIELASDFANKALTTAQTLGNPESKVRAYKILYLIAQQQQNYADALQYYIDYANADKAFLDEVQTRQLAFQMGQTQYIEQQNKIEQLNHQNNLLLIEQNLSKAKAQKNRLFITLLVIVLGILAVWTYRIKSRQDKLKYMAEYDELTGIFSRSHFKVLAQSALDYCDKTEQDICCIVFDLDKFKQINDANGHACGDWVLKHTIEVCKEQGRKNDIFARLGGEEFCVLLPGCNMITGNSFAQKCRRAIEAINTNESGYPFNITASFGVTSAKASGYDLEKMIADADKAMYASKHNGRNRVTQHLRDVMKEELKVIST